MSMMRVTRELDRGSYESVVAVGHEFSLSSSVWSLMINVLPHFRT